MSGKLYLRPNGFIWGDLAKQAVDAGTALRVAGGLAACLGFEVIEGEPGHARRRLTSARDLAASADTSIKATLERITSPRPKLAGLDFAHPLIMGIVNVTPDSFSDGGDFVAAEAAIEHARRLRDEGADIVDIGGESTRPGADAVDEAEELRRILPVLDSLRDLDIPVSIDTRKASVMEIAVQHGAAMINDVSALAHDPKALEMAGHLNVPVVLMHMRSAPRMNPQAMQDNPPYDDVLLNVHDFLEARIGMAEAAGLPRHRLIADPGIGFGKTLNDNLAVLAGIGLLHGLGVPLMIGTSRKRLIGTITGEADPKRRIHGNIGTALAAAAQAVQILRVHDVAATRQALDAWFAAVCGRWQGRA